MNSNTAGYPHRVFVKASCVVSFEMLMQICTIIDECVLCIKMNTNVLISWLLLSIMIM